MASFLLGDDYASSSSSSDEETSPTSCPHTIVPSPAARSAKAQILPSADELFSSDTSGVLTTSSVSTASATTHKRKNEQVSRPATKAVKTGAGEAARKPKIAPFAPPQLRRPNISTEDRSSWNTDKTLAMQRKAKEAEAREKM
ncbi:hypothetical protein F442_00590 [Phytophthora nicotianae P10297]|uniref:Uncharacterized protein n=3 Tax=Phytophthora nicotianae TaxID=4792 RepID=V9G1W7_PHYNI|nr:hypothetical protein F443_00607 [Phytophthora nicotianae P1569]ETM56482.1 hypothetical protein L914_00557 [Phytophthora nicotianae]ETP54775.1 hypothetical protein F442_00590 [Phytophthora nicotianae P10297]KUF76243.1 hypothetical protein AM587_10005885 [Phytophthora nicotianae]KUF88626.1 hypothetical protein AM587_10005018 [Phytophthora nicotianae]